MIKLQFDIEPVAKGRPRFTRSGHSYTPERTRTFEKAIKDIATDIYDGEVLEGPLSARIVFSMKRGKTVKREYPTVKPDLDNLIKGVLDSLNGIVYKDDSQIVEIAASKKYSNEGMIQLVIYNYE